MSDFAAQLRAAAALTTLSDTVAEEVGAPVDSTVTLQRLAQLVEKTYGVYEARKARADALRFEQAGLSGEVQLLTLAETALTTLLQQVSADSLQAIEQTVTYGLQTVFDDHPLTFRFAVTQARGGQSVEPVLRYGQVEAFILDAFGGGPAQVVAFLLRLIVCHRMQLYPLVLLDESFSMVNPQYLPNLAKLLRELAEKLGYTFLLVTQDVEFLEYADRGYRLQETGAGVIFQRVGSL